MTRIASLQVLRAVAAIAVVLDHAAAQLGHNLGFHTILDTVNLGERGVTLFFVLSGFIILRVHMDDPRTLSHLKRYAWKRAARILPFTFIVATIWAAVTVAASRVVADVEVVDPATWVSTALLLPLAKPDPGVIWSLRHEVLFYGVFALSFWSRRAFVAALALWMGAALLIPDVGEIHLAQGTGQIIHATFFSDVNVLFALGLAVACIDRMAPQGDWSKPLFAVALTALAVGAALLGERAYDPVSLSVFGLLSAFAILVATRVQIDSPVWRLLGDASFAIYLIHPIVLPLALPFLRAGGLLPPTAIFAAQVLLCVGVGCLFHITVERPIQRGLQYRRAPILG